MEIVTSSPQESQELGQQIAALLRPGDVLTLTGDLGAGKTCFTQGIGRGLGIKRPVTSPTFNLIKEYQGKYPLYHFDLYRIEEEEMTELGYEDYFYGEGITVIEWPEKAGSLLPAERLEIKISRGEGEKRIFHFFPLGFRGQEIVKAVEKGVSTRD